ncbi:MAG: hypothetical protein LBE74_08070 [Treponema sp.]|jgi:hypothetical protein|nr:hypothetical protein [Treponema sp.]
MLLKITGFILMTYFLLVVICGNLFPERIFKKYFNTDEQNKLFNLNDKALLGAVPHFCIMYFSYRLLSSESLGSFFRATGIDAIVFDVIFTVIFLMAILILFIPAIFNAKHKKAMFLFLLKFISAGPIFAVKISAKNFDYEGN